MTKKYRPRPNNAFRIRFIKEILEPTDFPPRLDLQLYQDMARKIIHYDDFDQKKLVYKEVGYEVNSILKEIGYVIIFEGEQEGEQHKIAVRKDVATEVEMRQYKGKSIIAMIHDAQKSMRDYIESCTVQKKAPDQRIMESYEDIITVLRESA